MINYNELKEEVDKKLKDFDSFFQKDEHRLLIFMYIMYVCEKRLGKKEYRFTLAKNGNKKEEILVDIETDGKNLKPFVITERKINRLAKECSLPE
jgi:hypothetical protein